MQSNQHILFIDNECILCSKIVQWVIKIDKNKLINFSSLRSHFAKTNLPPLLLPANETQLSTVIYYDGIDYYQKSTAIIKMLRSLNGLWKITNILYLIPKILRDGLYNLIANYRLKLFGRSDVCLLESNISIDRIIK